MTYRGPSLDPPEDEYDAIYEDVCSDTNEFKFMEQARKAQAVIDEVQQHVANYVKFKYGLSNSEAYSFAQDWWNDTA